MNRRILLVVVSCALSVLLGLALRRGDHKSVASPSDQPDAPRALRIGLSLDTLKEERWQTDRDLFVKQAEELGAEVLVQSANGDDAVQIGDVEKLLTNQVDVLVIVPHDGEAMAKAVKLAHAEGVPVIAYDRIIKNSDLDLYISFDNERVGRLQAQYLVDSLPNGKGKIVRIYGAKTDNNAKQFKAGQDQVLQPYIERGDIEVVFEDWADDWKPENAKRIVNAAITAKGSEFAAVLASNDGTAGGATQALAEEGLAGKKIVTGQDAELVAVQRIASGTQSMTIYKPLHTLAKTAAELAVNLGEKRVIVAKHEVENGKRMVPSVLLDVVSVTKDNLVSTVIADGFHQFEDVYRSVPESERPSKASIQAAKAKK